MITKKIIQSSHCFRAEMDLKVAFCCKGKIRINRVFMRKTDTDYMSCIVPIHFGEKCCIEVQSVPFRGNMPYTVRINFVAFRHVDLE